MWKCSLIELEHVPKSLTCGYSCHSFSAIFPTKAALGLDAAPDLVDGVPVLVGAAPVLVDVASGLVGVPDLELQKCGPTILQAEVEPNQQILGEPGAMAGEVHSN